MQNFHRYRKTGLNIDNEEGLFHDVIIHMTRIRCNAGTHPVFSGDGDDIYATVPVTMTSSRTILVASGSTSATA